jgi:hypothetical protein
MNEKRHCMEIRDGFEPPLIAFAVQCKTSMRPNRSKEFCVKKMENVDNFEEDYKTNSIFHNNK